MHGAAKQMNNDELLLQISEIMDKKLKPLNEKIDQIREENSEAARSIKIILENDILPRLQNIESCYTDTYKRYVIGVEQLEALQTDMEILKRVVSEHSRKLQNL